MVDGPEIIFFSFSFLFFFFFFFFRVNVQAGHDCRWVATYIHKIIKEKSVRQHYSHPGYLIHR